MYLEGPYRSCFLAGRIYWHFGCYYSILGQQKNQNQIVIICQQIVFIETSYVLLETSSYNYAMCVTTCWTSPICTCEQWSLQGFLHPLMILSPVTGDPVWAEIHDCNSHTCSESRFDLLCEASTWVMLLRLPQAPSRHIVICDTELQ